MIDQIQMFVIVLVVLNIITIQKNPVKSMITVGCIAGSPFGQQIIALQENLRGLTSRMILFMWKQKSR